MSRQVCFGDQVYIEISNLQAPPNTEKRLLCSAGFLEETVFGVKSSNYHHSNFRNCIFTIIPSLVDSKEDAQTINSLRTELSLLSTNKSDSIAQKYLSSEIDIKEKQIEKSQNNMDTLNHKILNEMDGKDVYFGEVVLLQHLESGYFLCAESSHHPNNPSLHNLRLQKERTPKCYFKFFSYLSPTERTPFDYQSEMKLISVHLNTVVTLGELKTKIDSSGLTAEDSEPRNLVKPPFPDDEVRRNNILSSFGTEPFAVGTTLESPLNHRVKLVEYCSKADLIAYSKKRIFKNGDYVRFNINDFYLTAAFQKDKDNQDRPSISLAKQKSEGYKYHFINSIFQIVRMDQENPLPIATEVQSLQKKFSIEDNHERFCIKHFATDSYLSAPQEVLYNPSSDKNKNYPVFSFIHDHSNSHHSLTRNSRVSLKTFKSDSILGTYYLESDLNTFRNLPQYDLNSKGFIGFKYPTEKLKHKMKAVSKSITENQNVGSFFQLSLVSDEEIKDILEFESYANAFKHFMKLLQGSMRKHPSVTEGLFKNGLSSALAYSEQLKIRTGQNNPEIQHMIREFRILDIFCRFFYYFLISHDIASAIEKFSFEMEEVVKLLMNFGDIIINCIKNNELSYLYVAQYVKTFISCLLNPSSFYTYCNRKQIQDTRNCLVILLYNFLRERDLDTFAQLAFYEEDLFRNLDLQQDFSIHLLQLMNHFFKSDCPNVKNGLRENFIKYYIGNSERIGKLFPRIKLVRTSGKVTDFEIFIERENHPSTMLLSKVGTEVHDYLTYVFKVIASTSKSNSLQFSQIVMNYYDEETCENLLVAQNVPSKLKNSVLSMLKSVHSSYNKLPFDRISPKIQMLLNKESTEKWQIIFGSRIRDAENSLISQEELRIIQQTNKANRAAARVSIYKLSIDTIQEGHDQVIKGELDVLPFILQVAKGVLEEDELTEESLCLVHHFLSAIVEKVAEELKNKSVKHKYYDFFLKNTDAIFDALLQVDKCVVNFAFRESLEVLKEKLFHFRAQTLANETENSPGRLIHEPSMLEGTALASLTGSFLEPWKSKEKLYQKAGRTLEGAYLEDRLRKSLWEIIENTNGELAHDINSIIRNKINFEENVNEQLTECALIDDENEIFTFDQLVTSLLNLNRIERKLHLITEFELQQREDDATLSEVVRDLENICLCIYDYETHMKEENKTITKEKAKEVFLQRFTYSKINASKEIPFRYKGHCVKKFYQKILKTLDAHEILVPYLKHFVLDLAWGQVNTGNLNLGNRFVMAILMIFMNNNPANQNLMSSYPPFISGFYTDAILDSSVEAVYMFTEMLKGNKKLLKLGRDYLFSVAVRDFVDYYYNELSQSTDKPATLNYIRSLPVILSSKIPQDLFEPADFMIDTFMKFSQQMAQNNQLSLLEKIRKAEDKNAIRNIDEVIQQNGVISSEIKLIQMPLFYSMLKELLESQKLFALTEDKERVLILQNRFTLEKIIPFLKNENIMFNFELKQLTVETLENIFFRSIYKNVNIFTDYDEFKSFASMLLIDAYGYLKYLLPANDDFFSLFENPTYFGSQKCFEDMRKYDQLLEFDLGHIGFSEYQSIILLKQTWKKYIYYILCDIFGHFIFNFKDYMLNTKDRSNSSNCIFEIWLKVVLKLRSLDQDAILLDRLDNALKNAVVHSEYAHRKEIISAALEPRNLGKLSSAKGTMLKREISKNEEANNILEKFLHDRSDARIYHLELNIKKVAIGLGMNNSVLKSLIGMLYRSDMHTGDILFVLKLLRKVIEIENKSEKDDLKPIYLWGDVSELEFTNIRKNQDVLVELGIVPAIFSLLYDYQKDRSTVTEILFLCIAMLYGGNKVVQDAFYAEFREDSDNEIISNFAQILEEVLETFRMKEGHKTQESYVNTLRFVYSFLSNDRKVIPGLPAITGNTKGTNKPVTMKTKILDGYREHQQKTKVSHDKEEYNLPLIILEFFQNLCEGHHFNFQEFLRDQTILGYSKSSNIPEILRQAYSIYHKYINIDNVDIGIKILDMLIEIQQGASEANVDLLLKKTFISDLCNTLVGFNTDLDLLARGFEFNSSHKRFVEIKSKVLVLLKDLVERSDSASLKKISKFIDLNALAMTFRDNIIAFHHSKNAVLLDNKTYETKDMWDSNLSSAFTINFILRHISFEESPEEFSPEIKDALAEAVRGNPEHENIVNHYITQFFIKHTGAIEIFQGRSNKLLKIYFPIPPSYAYLKEDTKQEFSARVDRTNTMTKITELIDASPELIGQMNIEYNSRNRLFGINLNNAYTYIRLLTNIISIGVVFNDLFGLTYGEEGAVYISENVNTANDTLSAIQAALAGVLIVLWLQTKLGRFLAFKWDAFCHDNIKEEGALSNEILQKIYDREKLTPEMIDKVLRLKGPYSDEWKLVETGLQHRQAFYDFIFIFQSGAFLWHIIYLGICIGSIFHPLATAFQLFDIIVRSDTVSRIWMSVSRNLRQFMWTLILLLVTVYVYTLIGFHFLHERYEDPDIGDFCPDAYSCYIANMNFGLRNGGGIADSLTKVVYTDSTKGYYLGTALFDLTFFILMITLMLNLIFGMIIDAFGDLRDEKTANEEDKANNCFICGLQRSEFERFGRFEDHIFKEHNMWQYIAYIIYLNEKGKVAATDFTDIEDYVDDRNKKKDLIWIPVGRSLTLERQLAKEEKERKSEIEKLRDDMESSFHQVLEQNKKLATKLDGVCTIIETSQERAKPRTPSYKKSMKP